jgi:murein endopeptidase
MRLLVGFVVASGLLASSAVPGQAKTKSDDAKHEAKPTKHHKPEAEAKPKGVDAKHGKTAKSESPAKAKTRAARITTSARGREHIEPREVAHGQSVGEPWAGRLQHPTQLPPGDGYVIRRPQRAFGTETTVELVERAIGETLEAFPDEHVLAIGDMSAETGGSISQHRSHQSGRDVDIGLFYNEQPEGYPENFVHATEDNLDCGATLKLIESFRATEDDDGGVQMIFLDYDVQGILYNWAIEHGYSEDRLGKIFQYAHGRGASEGLVRHWPAHDNHIHVRFKCPDADTACH